jgi:prepilin-type N-terminal cleavage/methylation domain-containing protein
MATPKNGISPLKSRGFTMIELLVVIGIIGLLMTIAAVVSVGALKKARDAKRKADLAQIGRLLTLSCYLPEGGSGDYDFAAIFAELKVKNPQISQMMARAPHDPRNGSDAETRYRYVVSTDGAKCAVYANLENASEPVTITNLTEPTPGGGTGVLKTASTGSNGTDRYFEATN